MVHNIQQTGRDREWSTSQVTVLITGLPHFY